MTALVAIWTLPAISSQMRSARSTSEAQTLGEFLDRSKALADGLFGVDDSEKRRFAFLDYANFLELYAGLVNARVLHAKAHEIIRHKLISAFAIIETTPDFSALLISGLDTPDTFMEINRFLHKNKSSINAVVISLERSSTL